MLPYMCTSTGALTLTWKRKMYTNVFYFTVVAHLCAFCLLRLFPSPLAVQTLFNDEVLVSERGVEEHAKILKWRLITVMHHSHQAVTGPEYEICFWCCSVILSVLQF